MEVFRKFIEFGTGSLVRVREVEAQNHQGRKIRFKIVEKGGVTLEKMLRRSNPWSSENCGRADCFPCKGGEGGSCWREGVTYTLFCVECGEEVAAYFGESGGNGYTRGKEHFEKKLAKDEDNSVLWLHSLHHHQGREDVPYNMKVTGGYLSPWIARPWRGSISPILRVRSY